MMRRAGRVVFAPASTLAVVACLLACWPRPRMAIPLAFRRSPPAPSVRTPRRGNTLLADHFRRHRTLPACWACCSGTPVWRRSRRGGVAPSAARVVPSFLLPARVRSPSLGCPRRPGRGGAATPAGPKPGACPSCRLRGASRPLSVPPTARQASYPAPTGDRPVRAGSPPGLSRARMMPRSARCRPSARRGRRRDAGANRFTASRRGGAAYDIQPGLRHDCCASSPSAIVPRHLASSPCIALVNASWSPLGLPHRVGGAGYLAAFGPSVRLFPTPCCRARAVSRRAALIVPFLMFRSAGSGEDYNLLVMTRSGRMRPARTSRQAVPGLLDAPARRSPRRGWFWPARFGVFALVVGSQRARSYRAVLASGLVT